MALIVTLVNVSDLADVSDYNYEVLVGDGTIARSTVLATGRINGHRRMDGWSALVQRVLVQEHQKKDSQ